MSSRILLPSASCFTAGKKGAWTGPAHCDSERFFRVKVTCTIPTGVEFTHVNIALIDERMSPVDWKLACFSSEV